MKTPLVNVGGAERLAAGALAGVLLPRLLARPGWFKLAVLGCLTYRALRGHCFGYEMCGYSTCPTPAPKPSHS